MSTIETVNEVALREAGNRLNQIPVEHRNLIGHWIALKKEQQSMISEITRELGLRPVDPRSPGYAVTGFFAGAKAGYYSPLLAFERMIQLIEETPDFQNAHDAVHASLAEIAACEAAITEDRRRADQALADLQAKEAELKARALAALQDDPDLAKLRDEVARAEAVLAGAQPPADPVSAERAAKAKAALSGIRRKGQPLVAAE
jgi:hypothetical protein